MPPSLLERLVRPLSTVAAGVAAILVLVALATVSYSVFMRYVLGTPVTFTDELSGYLVVGMVALGAADVLLRGEHFGVDLITANLSKSRRRLIDLWGMVTVMLVASAVIYSAVLMVRFSYDFGIYSEGYLGVAMWIPQSALLVGMAILLIAAFARFVTLLTAKDRS